MKAIVLSPLNKCIEIVHIDQKTAKSKKRIEEEIEYCAGCDIDEVSYMLCEDSEVPVFRNGEDEPFTSL